jgi:hypothetical protein
VILLLLSDELIQITTVAKLHNYVELLSLDDRLTIRYDIDVFELFKELDLIEDILGLLLVFVSEFYLFYDIVFVLGNMANEISIAKGPK